MTLKNNTWMDDPNVSDRAFEKTEGKDLVYFGYQKVLREDKVHRTRLHFESIARRYDFMNTLLSFGIHYLWKRSAIRMMRLKDGDRVLDVCGGTGDLSILAVRAVGSTGKVVLADINAAMIQAGKNKKAHASLRKQIRFVHANAEALSFPDGVFDAAMVGFGIRNVSCMEKGFEEMHRVLKPGGKLMCLEFSKPTAPFFCRLYDFYSFVVMPFLGGLLAGSRRAYTHLPESIRTFSTPDQLAAMLQQIGFRRVSYRRLTNGIAVVHTGEKV